MVVDPASGPYFFVGAAVGSASRLCMGLAISRAVLTSKKIAVGFFELPLE